MSRHPGQVHQTTRSAYLRRLTYLKERGTITQRDDQPQQVHRTCSYRAFYRANAVPFRGGKVGIFYFYLVNQLPWIVAVKHSIERDIVVTEFVYFLSLPHPIILSNYDSNQFRIQSFLLAFPFFLTRVLTAELAQITESLFTPIYGFSIFVTRNDDKGKRPVDLDRFNR